jgi:hypothetical protein
MQSTSYKILSNILLSRLSPYINEVIGDYQFEFQFRSEFLHSVDTGEKNGNTVRQYISCS